MGNRLPTHQPPTPGCQPHLQVGRLATKSPLETLVARILGNHPPTPVEVRPEVVPATPTTTSPDPQADDETLLKTPLAHLAAPLGVFSSVLGETIYLVANDGQAAAVWAMGGVPYTPPEVAILRELEASATPEVWADRLRLIHRAKRDFQARLVPSNPKARLLTLLDTWARMDEAAWTQEAVDRLKDKILDLFRDHSAEADKWYSEWRKGRPT